jgi:hypothetical protein
VIADIGELYISLSAKLTCIVGGQVKAPSAVIDDGCQFAWYQLVVHARRVERDAALSWLVMAATHEARGLTERTVERQIHHGRRALNAAA